MYLGYWTACAPREQEPFYVEKRFWSSIPPKLGAICCFGSPLLTSSRAPDRSCMQQQLCCNIGLLYPVFRSFADARASNIKRLLAISHILQYCFAPLGSPKYNAVQKAPPALPATARLRQHFDHLLFLCRPARCRKIINAIVH